MFASFAACLAVRAFTRGNYFFLSLSLSLCLSKLNYARKLQVEIRFLLFLRDERVQNCVSEEMLCVNNNHSGAFFSCFIFLVWVAWISFLGTICKLGFWDRDANFIHPETKYLFCLSFPEKVDTRSKERKSWSWRQIFSSFFPVQVTQEFAFGCQKPKKKTYLPFEAKNGMMVVHFYSFRMKWL